jgi:hypothetical protein
MSDVIVSAEAVEEVRSAELQADIMDEQWIGSWSTRPARAGCGP